MHTDTFVPPNGVGSICMMTAQLGWTSALVRSWKPTHKGISSFIGYDKEYITQTILDNMFKNIIWLLIMEHKEHTFFMFTVFLGCFCDPVVINIFVFLLVFHLQTATQVSNKNSFYSCPCQSQVQIWRTFSANTQNELNCNSYLHWLCTTTCWVQKHTCILIQIK